MDKHTGEYSGRSGRYCRVDAVRWQRARMNYRVWKQVEVKERLFTAVNWGCARSKCWMDYYCEVITVRRSLARSEFLFSRCLCVCSMSARVSPFFPLLLSRCLSSAFSLIWLACCTSIFTISYPSSSRSWQRFQRRRSSLVRLLQTF